MMDKRVITMLHELMVLSTKGVGESGLIYAAIMHGCGVALGAQTHTGMEASLYQL